MIERRDPVVPLGRQDLHLASHLFRAERLTLARELRGLTKVELASRVGKTVSAVSQYESGRIRPDARAVGALTLALGLTPGFFTYQGDSLISPSECHFRSLRSAGVRDRRRLLAQGSLLCDVLDELRALIQLPEEQVQSVGRTAESFDEIEEVASDVRRGWGLGLGPIPNMVRLLESKGTVVTRVPDACREVDAFSVWHRGRPLVFLLSEKDSPSRSRFDAAHELGHLVLHPDVAPGDVGSEREANRFAGAFLFPKEPFVAECPRRLDWDHLYELKRRWGVSASALVRRGYDLGIFSEATYRRAFMNLSKSGQRTREPWEPVQESPVLLRRSLELLGEERVEDMAARLGLSRADIESLFGLD